MINYFKVGILMIVTFTFDCILAYQIVNKVYKLNRVLGDPKNIPFAAVFHEVNFWLIIFAGFVVYLIWGFIFDFVMEAYEKLDKVSVALKSKDDKIDEYNEQIEIWDKTIYKNQEKFNRNKTRIKKMEEVLDSYFFKPKKFNKRYSEFLSGWVQCLNALKAGDSKVEEAYAIGESFLNKNLPHRDILEEE